ncbi:ABC transporter substrate-binding protein [uncultured Jannaschia sp.]|uniref:ABC transporter substrate-binding protein n=1 Tax=uncultured Jannaschia sp. TaxID=293347 RepID=UPI0026117C99|nr:ABC transporter substrate-binding protein [uncultured Jannaschia sp.]
MTYRNLKAGTAMLLALAASPAAAQELTIALASEPTAVDPHYHDLTSNNAVAEHIYSALGRADAQQNIQPGLATSWEAEDDNTWVFQLRDDVVFSDGSEFNADDVIFTYCRTMNNETSVGTVGESVVTNFASVETPDPHTLRITTKEIEPLMPELLAQIMILSEGIVEHDEITFDLENDCGVTGEWPGVDAFNTGEAAIGTGPFVLEEFTLGSGITLGRNENYFGEAPVWERVRMVPVPASGPRLAGLLSGDYDLIENPAARDITQIEAQEGLDYVSVPSNRIIFLQMDIGRDDSPFIRTGDGSNPFQDERVRRAVSMAIDRQAIVDRIMDGFATPAYQFIPDNMFGAIPDPEPLEYDPERATELLAEAGYPDGFGLTLHATNDRYINDSQVAQVVAQFLTRIGIQTELDAMTRSIFFSRRSDKEFSFAMGGWGSSEGGAASFLRQYVTTDNEDLGVGASNYGAWSDPEFDAILLEAISTVDEEKRAALLQRAEQMAVDKLGFIPLHFESSIWAFRDGLSYPGRADQYTLAHEVTQTAE